MLSINKTLNAIQRERETERQEERREGETDRNKIEILTRISN
jgi:hypothetical protein